MFICQWLTAAVIIKKISFHNVSRNSIRICLLIFLLVNKKNKKKYILDKMNTKKIEEGNELVRQAEKRYIQV